MWHFSHIEVCGLTFVSRKTSSGVTAEHPGNSMNQDAMDRRESTVRVPEKAPTEATESCALKAEENRRVET